MSLGSLSPARQQGVEVRACEYLACGASRPGMYEFPSRTQGCVNVHREKQNLHVH